MHQPALPPRQHMAPFARLLRDTYAGTPGLRLYRTEFGYYSLEAWYQQGLHACGAGDWDIQGWAHEFMFDPEGQCFLGGAGWCEAALQPRFPEEVLEDRGETEVIRDWAGRKTLVFKGRRSGFMPEYIGHPVHDRASFDREIAWRMDPDQPERWINLARTLADAQAAAARGLMISQRIIGCYMYLRSLIGPEELLYTFHDDPQLIHHCLERWLVLADGICARHQQHLVFDEVFFGEDICYNNGPLIGPDMIRSFLFPYYRQLLDNIRRRQLDQSRHLYVHVDSDGDVRPIIDLYREGIGMDVMSPFEVASGCDVVAIGQQHPGLVLYGGIDKRILAQGRPAIDRMLERIVPAMRARGGWIPTCDHGVPAEVPLADYRYYRHRLVGLGG